MVCRKRRYRDEIAAKLAMAQIQWKDGASRSRSEQRAYRCSSCKGKWHLTSRA